MYVFKEFAVKYLYVLSFYFQSIVRQQRHYQCKADDKIAEDPSKIQAAVFYSITSTQKGKDFSSHSFFPLSPFFLSFSHICICTHSKLKSYVDFIMI